MQRCDGRRELLAGWWLLDEGRAALCQRTMPCLQHAVSLQQQRSAGSRDVWNPWLAARGAGAHAGAAGFGAGAAAPQGGGRAAGWMQGLPQPVCAASPLLEDCNR